MWVGVCDAHELFNREWIELFDADDRGGVLTELGAFCNEIPIDLARAEDHTSRVGDSAVIDQRSKCS